MLIIILTSMDPVWYAGARLRWEENQSDPYSVNHDRTVHAYRLVEAITRFVLHSRHPTPLPPRVVPEYGPSASPSRPAVMEDHRGLLPQGEGDRGED
ncbi:unnamed protein product [Urochloa humidicola]